MLVAGRWAAPSARGARRIMTAAERHTRQWPAQQVWADGRSSDVSISARELMADFLIMPRDLRLMSTKGANLAVRPSYFIFRFPPLTGCVRADTALLLADHDTVTPPPPPRTPRRARARTRALTARASARSRARGRC